MKRRFPTANLSDPEFCARFHDEVQSRFKNLATALGWEPEDYDLYLTAKDDGTLDGVHLHHDTLRIAVYPWKGGPALSIYTCRSRQDRKCAPAHHMEINYLDDLPRLATKVNSIAHQKSTLLPELDINWRQPLPYHHELNFQIRLQAAIRKRFTRLAACLGWNEEDYHVYTSAQDRDTSESIWLHHDTCFLRLFPDHTSISFHACRSRKDHWGYGHAIWNIPIDQLDDLPALAAKISGFLILRKFTPDMRPGSLRFFAGGSNMNWRELVANHSDPDYKSRFHYEVKRRLTKLATALGFSDNDYDLRSIKGPDDCSGLIFLTHDELYVSVGQRAFAGWEIQIYFSESRGDRAATPRLQLPIELLDDIPTLALVAKDHISHKRNLDSLYQEPVKPGSFDWAVPVVGHPEPSYKSAYHAQVRERLKHCANYLNWKSRDYDLYSLRVSDSAPGKTILQNDKIHICVDLSNGHPPGNEIVLRPRDLGKIRGTSHTRTFPIKLLDNPVALMLSVRSTLKEWHDHARSDDVSSPR